MRRRGAVLLAVCALALCPAALRGQGHALPEADRALLLGPVRPNPEYADRQVRYGFTPGRRTINPAYHLMSSAMYAYQRLVSPLIMRHCPFTPSCSGYSKALIREYGLLKGTVCTADRLMRCNRIGLADAPNRRLLVEGRGHIHETVDRYRLR